MITEDEETAMTPAPIVQVNEISKTFTNKNETAKVLDKVSLDIEKGEIVSILGQSGCGKSTLLNMIGGFEKPDQGKVLVAGEPVLRPSRKCVLLFQNYGLLPWRNVLKNVELGIEEANMTAAERKDRAMSYLSIVGLQDKISLFPRHLSGGMQQRVAIARALAAKPELILMDEPFAALDTFTRYYLQDELLRIQRQEGTTVVLVTHDIDEAIYLSDRILLMSANPGRIHKELPVHLVKPRDRGVDDFQFFRKIILEEFHFTNQAVQEEYNI